MKEYEIQFPVYLRPKAQGEISLSQPLPKGPSVVSKKKRMPLCSLSTMARPYKRCEHASIGAVSRKPRTNVVEKLP